MAGGVSPVKGDGLGSGDVDSRFGLLVLCVIKKSLTG